MVVVLVVVVVMVVIVIVNTIVTAAAAYTTLQQQQQRPFVYDNSGEVVPEITFIHSLTACLCGYYSLSLITFLCLLRSMASSLFSCRVWLSFLTTSLHVFFGQPLALTSQLRNPCIFFTGSFWFSHYFVLNNLTVTLLHRSQKMTPVSTCVVWWCNGYDVGLANQRVVVRLAAVPLSGNNLRQVVHTHAPLSSSSINWYRSKDDDAIWLGR